MNFGVRYCVSPRSLRRRSPFVRYYRAMSPADERQPRKISSVHRVRRFVLANVLHVCLRLHAKTVGRCSRRRCKPLMTLYGTWEQAAVLRCLVFSKRVDPCRRCRSSSTTTTMITTFSLRQLQLEWHRKRQVVSCIGSSAPSLTSSSSTFFFVVSAVNLWQDIYCSIYPLRDNHSSPDGFKPSFFLINYSLATSVISGKFTAP